HDAARPILIEALAEARKAGDRRLLARCIGLQIYTCGDDLVAKQTAIKDAVARFRVAGDDRGVARTLTWLAELEFHSGEIANAMQHVNEALVLLRKRRQRAHLIVALVNSAAYHLWAGNVDKARVAAREAIAICREIQNSFDIPISLQHLASVAAVDGDARTAARLAGFVDARLPQIDEPRQQTEQMLYDRLMATLREQLSSDALAGAMAEGAALTEAEAIETGLRV
ncbi:MAG: hypothetical protein ACREM8_15200, partial [Vulcanimicrobiaceae bacterium]